MKNNYFYIILFFLISNFICLKVIAVEQFNFDVTEIEISEKGNIIKGRKKGTVTTNEGILISADQFEYDKSKNILKANGNVKFENKEKNYLIFSDEIKYFKNIEKINTIGDSKMIYGKNKIIEADQFEYDISKNIIKAISKVKFENKKKNYLIFSDEITYLKNIDRINTTGDTNFYINQKYEIQSKNVIFFEQKGIINSSYKTKVKDNKSNVYILDKFNYEIKNELLKGENIIVISNYGLPKSDELFLSNAMINLKNKEFKAKDTEFKIHKDVFNNLNNDPRLIGISSSGNKNIKIINKGIFTSCKKTDKCPPWSLQAEKIIHDKKKKQILYNNAKLRVYDFPVLYFPKFFHPDPTVERQSGLLKPQINNSNILGNSVSIPYYNVLSENKDFTVTTHIFENNLRMIENEYRQVNKNSDFQLNFGFVDGYRSSLESKKKNIFNFFSKYKQKLNFEQFTSGDLLVSIERVTNDTFLKVFDQNIQDGGLKPKNSDILESKAELFLNHESYNFNTGLIVYEDLQKKSSDRYQYILPYYNFDKIFSENIFYGSLNISSTGNNNLIDTNVLQSTITNDLNYVSNDFISNLGFKNNFDIDVKNLNSIGKNSSQYKSSPQVELMSIISFNSSLPLIKKQQSYNNYLTPKLSLKINPSDMKNYKETEKNINVKNIFSNNRLTLSDSLESGKSLTFGIDYKKESIKNFNNYLEINLAKIFRDQEEFFIPQNTTINKKESNLFGSIKTSFNELIKFEHNFALDKNYANLEYNELNTSINFKNLKSEFNFIKENGIMGNDSIFENSTKYELNEDNSISFNTRRNRKLNLTEYYNLVYEYKNDCLTAGIKYNKTFYEDRELKPSENLFFSITLIPLAEYEQKVSN
tara:strand:+ start:590 stop:3205 length:2616 start_codon:yes stop_codon:yes gene_type:complete